MAGDDELLIGDDDPDDRLATAESNPRSTFDGTAREARVGRRPRERVGGTADARGGVAAAPTCWCATPASAASCSTPAACAA